METKSGVALARIPPLRGPDSPQWFSLSLSLSKTPFLRACKLPRNHYFYSGFVQFRPAFSPPPKSPARPHPDMFTIICLFRGGDFCTFSFFFGLVFFIAPFSPLWTMETLESPCFIGFQLSFNFENFGLPEAPPALFVVDLEPFSKIGLKNAQKNSKHQVVNSAGWITPLFPPVFAVIFSDQTSFPLQTSF